MKTTIIKALLTSLVTIIAITSCSDTKTEYIKEYILLSESSFTFLANGNEELRITVESPTTWQMEIESGKDWITEIERTDKTITVRASVNDSGNERDGKLVFTAGTATESIVLNQLVPDYTTSRYRHVADGTRVIFSPQGTYMFYFDVNLNYATDLWEYTPVLMTVETGERRYFNKTLTYSEAIAVSDQGDMFAECGFVLDKHGQYYNNGEWMLYDDVAGLGNVIVYGCSSDGNIWVGSAGFYFDNQWVPVRWTNGNPEVLPMPEISSVGLEYELGGFALGCSADGSVIYGKDMDHDDLLVWRNGTVEICGLDVTSYELEEYTYFDWGLMKEVTKTRAIKKKKLRVDSKDFHAISRDGRYIVTTYYEEEANKSWPAWVDLSTGETTIMWDDSGKVASRIDTEGNIYFVSYVTGYIAPISNLSARQSAQDYLADKYGLKNVTTGMIVDTTPDGKYTLGRTFVSSQIGDYYSYWTMSPPEF